MCGPRRKPRSVGIAVVLLVGAASGCEAVLGLGGLSEDDPADAGAVDSTTPDASGVDAPPDRRVTPMPDAAGDVLAEARAGDAAASPCFPGNTHTICDDFDGIDAALQLMALWPTYDNGAGGSMSLESDAAVSPPNALAMEVDALDGGGATEGLSRTIPVTTASGIHCELDLRVERVDPGIQGFYVAGTSVSGAGGDPVTFSAISVALEGTGGSATMLLGSEVLYTSGSASPSFNVGGIPLEAWMHLAFQFVWPQDGGGTASLVVDYPNGQHGTAAFPLDVPHTVNAAQFGIGFTQATGSTSVGWLYEVDNYFCDVMP